MSKPAPIDEMQKDYVARLTVTQPDGEKLKYTFPVLIDTHGKPYLQASELYAETGYTLYDEGLRSTAVAESKITRVHPMVTDSSSSIPHGMLQYRGYSIKQLATTCTFLEASYLLLYGEMPDEETFKEFSDDIKTNRVLDKTTEAVIDCFDRQSDPMLILSAALSALAARYETQYDMHESDDRYKLAIRLIGKMPTLAAHIYKHNLGQRPIDPDESLGHAANFLHMILSTTTKSAELDQNHIKILDMILTLHADHQLAVSTFVARAVASTKAPTVSSIIAASLALSGPLHGGANLKVIELLKTIKEEDIPTIIEQAKDPNDPFRLPGFGHRVYKGVDPRAEVLRELTLNVIKNQPEEEELYQLAIKLEEAALADPYFAERNLFPNVDFYSGLALKAIGIPTELFIVIFAVSRVSGWLAHIEESWTDGSHLLRPKQYYTGLKERPLHWP